MKKILIGLRRVNKGPDDYGFAGLKVKGVAFVSRQFHNGPGLTTEDLQHRRFVCPEGRQKDGLDESGLCWVMMNKVQSAEVTSSSNWGCISEGGTRGDSSSLTEFGEGYSSSLMEFGEGWK